MPDHLNKKNQAILGTVIIVIVFGLYIALMIPGVIFEMTWIEMLKAPPGSGPALHIDLGP